ncbi:MAG: hypothetical protein ACR2MW_08345 [Chthoniobacterales bacterium]
MKTRILLAALFTFCLTSCASFDGVLRPTAVEQIQPGVTTEADLVALFGPPDTRLAATQGMRTEIDWFRSVPPEPASYLPVIGELFGGLDLEVQQLSVVLGPGDRVMSYRFYDSDSGVQSEKTRRRSTQDKGFRK